MKMIDYPFVLSASLCLFCAALPSTLLAQSNAPAPSRAAQSASPSFQIRAFQVVGDNPLTDGETSQILAPFLRVDATIDTLQKATAALEAGLVAKGFALHKTSLPPQEITDTVRIAIVKFNIGHVKVEGNQHYSEANIRRALPELQAGGTPSFERLAKQTALANESSARKLGVNLKASEQPDAIDATIRVKDSKPWLVNASLSNAGSKETGKDRFTLAASHANLWDRDHLADFAYTTSLQEPGRVHQYGVNYKIPVYPWAGAFSMSASSASVKGEFGGFTTNGAGHSLALAYIQQLGGAGGKRHFVQLKVEDKLSKATTVSGFVIGVDRRSRPLTVGYNMRSETDSSLWDMGANYSTNLVSGSGNDDVTYALEDANRNPRAHWRVLRLNATLVKPIEKNWQLLWRNQAQLTNQPLIAAEQIAAGNTLWLRGANGLGADRGWLSALDITTPELAKGLRALFFVDWVHLANSAATVSKPGSDTLSTAGLGLRYNASNGFYINADYASVLKGSTIPLTVNSLAPQKGDDRFYLTIGARF